MDGGRRLLRSLKEAFASPAPRRTAFAGVAEPRLEWGAEPSRPARRRRRGHLDLPLKAVAWAARPGAGIVMTAALFGSIFVYGFAIGGGYRDFVARHGELHEVLASGMGFGLDVVTIKGQRDLAPAELLAVAGLDERTTLPFVDAREIRDRIKSTPLVREASVRKLYPDQLLIEIQEREPYALWQKEGEVYVISADGTSIDVLRDDRYIDLPFVVGDGANARVQEFERIVAASGALKSHIRAGVLVTQRRWNVKLNTGVDVKLPEINPEAAIAALAQLAKDQRIVEKDLISIDMRVPGRLVARLTEEAAAARAEARKDRPARRGPA